VSVIGVEAVGEKEDDDKEDVDSETEVGSEEDKCSDVDTADEDEVMTGADAEGKGTSIFSKREHVSNHASGRERDKANEIHITFHWHIRSGWVRLNG
jgi:hypothetical protein